MILQIALIAILGCADVNIKHQVRIINVNMNDSILKQANVVDSFDVYNILKQNDFVRKNFPSSRSPSLYYDRDDLKRLGKVYLLSYSFLKDYSIFIIERDSMYFYAHIEGSSSRNYYIINKQLQVDSLWPEWGYQVPNDRTGFRNPINLNKIIKNDIIKGKIDKKKALFIARLYFDLLQDHTYNKIKKNEPFLIEHYLQIPHGKGMPIDSTNPVLSKPIDILSDQYHRVTLQGRLPDSLGNIIKPLTISKKDNLFYADCFTWLRGELFKCRLEIDVTGIRDIHVNKIGENIGTWSIEF